MLCEKCPNTKVSLVRVFPYLDWIRWIRENADQKKIRIWTLFTQCTHKCWKSSITSKAAPSSMILSVESMFLDSTFFFYVYQQSNFLSYSIWCIKLFLSIFCIIFKEVDVFGILYISDLFHRDYIELPLMCDYCQDKCTLSLRNVNVQSKQVNETNYG